MKQILLSLTIFFFALPALAGNGANTITYVESNFWFSVDSKGTTSSLITVHFPYSLTTTTQQIYFFSPNFEVNPTGVSYCAYSGGASTLLTKNGITFNEPNRTYQYRVDVTTGTISAAYHQQTNSIIGETYHLSSTPVSISESCNDFVASSSNWTNGYWDVDDYDMSSSVSSSQESIVFREPTYGTTPIPDFKYFILGGYNLVPAKQYLIKIDTTFASGTVPSTTLQAQTLWYGVTNDTSTEPTIIVPNTFTLTPSPNALREWNFYAYLCDIDDTDCSEPISSSTSYGAIKIPERLSATSNSTTGIFGGGSTPTLLNTIDYVTIASVGNAIDFGDLIAPIDGLAACSDGHGGLQ